MGDTEIKNRLPGGTDVSNARWRRGDARAYFRHTAYYTPNFTTFESNFASSGIDARLKAKILAIDQIFAWILILDKKLIM